MTYISKEDSTTAKIVLRRPVVSPDKKHVKYYNGQKFINVNITDPYPKENLFVRVAEQMQQFAFQNHGKINRKTASIMIGNITQNIRGENQITPIRSLFDNFLDDDNYITQDEQFKIMNILKDWCSLEVKEDD